jgi:large subunit ribosomal protein L13
MPNKTFSPKPADVNRQWYVVDASEVTLGRLSTKVASLLLGKGKAQFAHHMDMGDYVVVTNAANLKVTGKKMSDKIYYRHTGFPGGIRQRTLAEQMEKDPTQAIVKAVRGMLPNNKLLDDRLNRLKVYAGADHQHAAQKPQVLSFKEKK